MTLLHCKASASKLPVQATGTLAFASILQAKILLLQKLSQLIPGRVALQPAVRNVRGLSGQPILKSYIQQVKLPMLVRSITGFR